MSDKRNVPRREAEYFQYQPENEKPNSQDYKKIFYPGDIAKQSAERGETEIVRGLLEECIENGIKSGKSLEAQGFRAIGSEVNLSSLINKEKFKEDGTVELKPGVEAALPFRYIANTTGELPRKDYDLGTSGEEGGVKSAAAAVDTTVQLYIRKSGK